MKLTRIATPLIAVAMMTVPMMALAQSSQMGNATQNSTTDWATPPAGTEQAQAYRDGIEAAKLDAAAKRPVVAEKSHLYVAPPVKGADKTAYRSAFTAGYTAAVQHAAAAPSGL